MSRKLLFWVLMILWLIFGVFGFYSSWPDHGASARVYISFGGDLLVYILLLLLGWQVYGPPVQG